MGFWRIFGRFPAAPRLTDLMLFSIVKMHEQKNIIATSEIIWLIVGQVEKTAKGNVAHFLQTDSS